jgi:hypothetical protein
MVQRLSHRYHVLFDIAAARIIQYTGYPAHMVCFLIRIPSVEYCPAT